jgi:hypothetical protein
MQRIRHLAASTWNEGAGSRIVPLATTTFAALLAVRGRRRDRGEVMETPVKFSAAARQVWPLRFA